MLWAVPLRQMRPSSPPTDEDGLQLLSRWRRQAVELPVLVLTARDAVGQRIEGLQTGADDYLVKPFDLHELAARLHALLRRAASSCKSKGLTR